MALVAVAVAVPVMVVPPSAAAVEMVSANPTGAAWTAFAEITTISPLAPAVDATLGEEFAQALHGSADALLRRVIGRAESVANFA